MRVLDRESPQSGQAVVSNDTELDAIGSLTNPVQKIEDERETA